MKALDEQLIALGAVFEAATLVDRIARTGQVPNASLACMLGQSGNEKRAQIIHECTG